MTTKSGNPRFKINNFASRAKNDPLLQECLLEGHRTIIKTHEETVQKLRNAPHDRDLLNAVKNNRAFVSASCNLVAMMRGKKPTHWPREVGESIVVMNLLLDFWGSIKEEKDLVKSSSVLLDRMAKSTPVTVG